MRKDGKAVRELGALRITSMGVWVGLCDETCELNATAFWTRQKESLRAVLDSLRKAGGLLWWQVVMDGTFDIAIREASEFQTPDESTADILCRQPLLLPTGRLVCRTGGDEQLPRIVLAVPPGAYDVRFEWFIDQEARHYDIPFPSAYPAGEGPDGVVTLQRT